MEDIRKLVVTKMLNGRTQVKVAKDLNIGRTNVCYIFEKYVKTGEIDDTKRSDRPHKTTELILFGQPMKFGLQPEV